MRTWTARQWIIAGGAAALVALVMGLVTAIIDNPVFERMIPTPWWAYAVWIISSVLLGLLAGTYAAPQGQLQHERRSLGAGLLAVFAVGCPTCNVPVVLALGASGAMTWFQPLQPVLAVVSLVLLGAALRSRLRGARSCPVATPAEGERG